MTVTMLVTGGGIIDGNGNLRPIILGRDDGGARDDAEATGNMPNIDTPPPSE